MITKTLKITTIGLLTILAAINTAQAAIGTNPILDNETGGDLFIPFQTSQSGTLGDSVGGGDRVGMQSDSVTLSNSNPTSSGNVAFDMVFDITLDMGGATEINQNSASILLNLTDIDFKTTNYNRWDFREWITLDFMRDPNGATFGSTVTLDETNYWDYSGLAPNHETNNLEIVYTISLRDDFGLTNDDFANIEGDKVFALGITMYSDLAYTGPSDRSTSPNNTSESIGNRVEVVGVPEPTSMVMLAVGSVALLRRRNR